MDFKELDESVSIQKQINRINDYNKQSDELLETLKTVRDTHEGSLQDSKVKNKMEDTIIMMIESVEIIRQDAIQRLLILLKRNDE